MTNKSQMPDGLDLIKNELPLVMKMIAQTAQWVHPDVFRALPLWYPEYARKAPLYNADWMTRRKNKGEPKLEGNVAASTALTYALGIVGGRARNWTTCHIWGYDDDRYVGKGSITQDNRFYSCLANMVLLPTPLKGFTDVVPEIKEHLRVCAFHLYGWACEHETAVDAALVRTGRLPAGYPEEWPTGNDRKLPPGTGPDNVVTRKRIANRKAEIAQLLKSDAHPHYPRDKVRAALDFWRIKLAD
jgi:hypothetical protein